MQIDELKVTVGEVCEGYFNDAEEGVVGYDERLDIRPKYQREFVYKDAQRDEVIRTVMKGLPLNVIYWCKVKKDDGSDGYEVLDGQQRTISLCEYVDGSFSVDDKYFYNLPSDQKKKILDYPLFVYVCDGTDSEKLDWFRIINIAGEQLTDQERCVCGFMDFRCETLLLKDRLCRRNTGGRLSERCIDPAGVSRNGDLLGGQRRGKDHRSLYGRAPE